MFPGGAFAGKKKIPAFALDFIDSGLADAAGASQSTTMDFGDAPPAGETRYIVLGVGITVVSSITSVTIGGIAATVVADGNDGGTHGALYIAEVPSGTSGTVALTFSDSGQRAGLATYRLMNPSSATPSDVTSDTGGGDNNDGVASLSLDIPAGGAAIGAACSFNDLGGANVWVGLTADAAFTLPGGSGAADHFTSASLTSEAGATPLTVSYTSDSNDIGGASASWGPITA
jgi:hypothetical protein